MWVIGVVVCMGLMLAGHALTNSGHGSHSREVAGGVEPVAAPAPDGAPAEAAPENAPQVEAGDHH